MSDNSESNVVLGFVVGAIVVAALAFFLFVAPGQRGGGDVDVHVAPPAAPTAPANPG